MPLTRAELIAGVAFGIYLVTLSSALTYLILWLCSSLRS